MRSFLSQLCAIWCSLRREVQQVSLTVDHAPGDYRRWTAANWTNKLLYYRRCQVFLALAILTSIFSPSNGSRRESHSAHWWKCKWPQCVFLCFTGKSHEKKLYRQQKAFLDLQKLLKHGRKYVSIINGGFDAIESHILTPDSQLDPAQLRVKFFYTLLQLK